MIVLKGNTDRSGGTSVLPGFTQYQDMEIGIKYLLQFFCVAVCLPLALPAGAQQPRSDRIAGKPLIALHPERKATVPAPMMYNRMYWEFPFKTPTPSALVPSGPTPLKPAFSPADLAFFCRLEYKMEKALKFPLRIRLGEVQYVEEMEGKINSMRINPARREDGPR
ncbi:MAG: hypothetical protein ACOYOO_07340 [Saprospiraceae bacterium]|jgi:hypothetical protein